MTELLRKQILFSNLISKLIAYAYSLGYGITVGDFWAHSGHIDNSNHYIRLAADLNLFKLEYIYNSTGDENGKIISAKYLKNTEDHLRLGEYWERLNPDCRWGGRFGDGNHYSLSYKGRA